MQLKKELAETDSVYDTEKLSERIAKLSGGVAVIKVRGGGGRALRRGRSSRYNGRGRGRSLGCGGGGMEGMEGRASMRVVECEWAGIRVGRGGGIKGGN